MSADPYNKNARCNAGHDLYPAQHGTYSSNAGYIIFLFRFWPRIIPPGLFYLTRLCKNVKLFSQSLRAFFNFSFISFSFKGHSKPSMELLEIFNEKDGIKVLKTIQRMYRAYKPLKFYGLIAIILFFLGLIVGIPVIAEFATTKYISKVPSAILATGLMSLTAIFMQCGIILNSIERRNKENYELNILRYEQIENLKSNLQQFGRHD